MVEASEFAFNWLNPWMDYAEMALIAYLLFERNELRAGIKAYKRGIHEIAVQFKEDAEEVARQSAIYLNKIAIDSGSNHRFNTKEKDL